jgi:hypothetical protein
MKPCAKNRRPIAWLALGALESGPARELRAHLEVCPACRSYFHEIAIVTEKLGTAKPASDLEASTAFHRRVVAALRNQAALAHRLVRRTGRTRYACRCAVLVVSFAVIPEHNHASAPDDGWHAPPPNAPSGFYCPVGPRAHARNL